MSEPTESPENPEKAEATGDTFAVTVVKEVGRTARLVLGGWGATARFTWIGTWTVGVLVAVPDALEMAQPLLNR